MMQRISWREKRWIFWALGIFVATALLAIVINSISWGWHWNFSISRYVGLETWSAILFALGNIFVAGLIGKYLYAVGEKWRLGRWFYYAAIVMAVTLIGLSACPVGYFDRFVGGKSMPSFVHELCSRTMFACMLLVAFMIQFCQSASRAARCWCAIFVAYGTLCLVAYLGEFEWFFQMMLVFESCYIVGFMIICCGLQSKDKVSKRS